MGRIGHRPWVFVYSSHCSLESRGDGPPPPSLGYFPASTQNPKRFSGRTLRCWAEWSKGPIISWTKDTGAIQNSRLEALDRNTSHGEETVWERMGVEVRALEEREWEHPVREAEAATTGSSGQGQRLGKPDALLFHSAKLVGRVELDLLFVQSSA